MKSSETLPVAAPANDEQTHDAPADDRRARSAGVVLTRRKRRAFKLLLVGAGLLVGLLVAEAALRVVGYSYPVFYVPDEALGYALRPGMEGWYRKEGAAYVRINSDGMRDREHLKAKPPDTVRIAVLGDSYAEALQVDEREAFWSVLEKRLGACAPFAGRRVEVLNFGVSGYGTAQELITLRRKVWDYSPDIVLLAVTTNNDITDNSRELKKTDEIPYFVRRDGRLVLDESFHDARAFRLRNSVLSRAGSWIRDHLRVIQLIHQAHGALKAYIKSPRTPSKPEAQPTQAAQTAQAVRTRRDAGGAPDAAPAADVPRATSAAQADELGVDNLIYRAPSDAVWNEAWSVTEELLVEMRDEVQSKGAKFLVVTLSNGIQVYPDEGARTEFLRRTGATDLFYPDLRIKSLGERAGFPVLNLAPALQAYADEHKVFLHGFGAERGNGHWNALGHAQAGELIAESLCAGAAQ